MSEPPEVVQPKVELVLNAQMMLALQGRLCDAVRVLEAELHFVPNGTDGFDDGLGMVEAVNTAREALLVIKMLAAGLCKQEGLLWPTGVELRPSKPPDPR